MEVMSRDRRPRKASCKKRRLAVWVSMALLAALWSQSRAEEPARSDRVKLVSLGKITAIDLRKKSFEMESETSDATDSDGVWREGGGRRDGSLHGSISIGTGGGRRRGIDSGRQSSEWPPSSRGNDEPAGPRLTTRVRTTAETIFNDGDKPVVFEGLKIGDSVEVTGVLKGKDIEAVRIVRKPEPSTDR